MSFKIHLWEYDNCYFGDVPLNHKAKDPYYNSWDLYLEKEEDIRSCNCAYNACILYFNWMQAEDFEEFYWEEEGKNRGWEEGKEFLKERGKYELLTLIIPDWSSGVTSIKIRVKRSDEEKIKEYLKKNLPSFLTEKN